MAQQSNQATKVITGEVRLSYAHLFEPYAQNENQDKKYSCVILVSKKTTDGKATIKKIQTAQRAALEAGKDTKFGGRIPKDWKNTFRDGDDPDEDIDYERNPEFKGNMFMTVSSKTRPGVVDRERTPIEDTTLVYSGCYARVSINAFPFNTQGNKGVSFGLNHVQKLRDGEFLGGRSSAEDDFNELDEDEYADEYADEIEDLV